MRILVTRPKHQATQLVDDLQSAGYQTDCLPLLDIVPIEFSEDERIRVGKILQSAGKVIAVSANAARLSLPLLAQSQIPQPVFCIGPSTSSVLEEAGYAVRIPDGSYNSESLLKLPEFELISGQIVAILCGQGGRDYLEEMLAEMGGKVRRIELYSRQPLGVESLEIEHLEIPDALTAMSGDTAEALARALDLTGREEWKSLPLVVPGKRVSTIAENLGFNRIVATDKPTTEGLIDALAKMQQKAGNSSGSDPQAV
ncbi:MAG: uroporphyrinogen-III synthase [Porticoccaceae bacterium]